jgi:hypothetical protein
MASPYMVHEVAALWQQFPHLTPKEIRELFNSTAHKLLTDVPIKSNGYVDLKAALLKAKLNQLNGKQAAHTGPNCWNTATYMTGLSADIHYTTENEFRALLGSPLCKEVPADQTIKGDLIALRRYSKSNMLLPAAMLSEVHGYTDMGDGTGLTKNGTQQKDGYVIQNKSDIFNFYRSKEFMNGKMLGLDKRDYDLKAVAYRCQSSSEFFKGKLRPREQRLLLQTDQLEREVGAYFFEGKEMPALLNQRLNSAQQNANYLEKNGSSSVFTSFILNRLNSISSKF